MFDEWQCNAAVAPPKRWAGRDRRLDEMLRVEIQQSGGRAKKRERGLMEDLEGGYI